ncbi:hypothetical protein [Roseivivax sp. CAU 1753]
MSNWGKKAFRIAVLTTATIAVSGAMCSTETKEVTEGAFWEMVQVGAGEALGPAGDLAGAVINSPQIASGAMIAKVRQERDKWENVAFTSDGAEMREAEKKADYYNATLRCLTNPKDCDAIRQIQAERRAEEARKRQTDGGGDGGGGGGGHSD